MYLVSIRMIAVNLSMPNNILYFKWHLEQCHVHLTALPTNVHEMCVGQQL